MFAIKAKAHADRWRLVPLMRRYRQQKRRQKQTWPLWMNGNPRAAGRPAVPLRARPRQPCLSIPTESTIIKIVAKFVIRASSVYNTNLGPSCQHLREPLERGLAIRQVNTAQTITFNNALLNDEA